MDHYFWNSIDAKKFQLSKKKANSMTQSRDAGGKVPALSRVELLLIVRKVERYLSKSLTVCTDGRGDIVESADKGMKVLVTGQ